MVIDSFSLIEMLRKRHKPRGSCLEIPIAKIIVMYLGKLVTYTHYPLNRSTNGHSRV